MPSGQLSDILSSIVLAEHGVKSTVEWPQKTQRLHAQFLAFLNSHFSCSFDSISAWTLYPTSPFMEQLNSRANVLLSLVLL